MQSLYNHHGKVMLAMIVGMWIGNAAIASVAFLAFFVLLFIFFLPSHLVAKFRKPWLAKFGVVDKLDEK